MSGGEAQAPPGPRRYQFVRVARRLLSRDTELQYVTELVRQYGDFVKLPLPGPVYLLNHPDYVKHVLQTHYTNYVRDPAFARLKLVLGENLLTADGAFWRRQRRIAQPAFHPQSIMRFAEIFTTCTGRMLDRWHEAPDALVDVHRELMRLTMDIVTRALFGSVIGEHWEVAARAFKETQEWGYRHRWLPIPPYLPTPGNRRFKAACQTLDRVVYALIQQRRTNDQGDHDLLTMLMQARDEETGEGMTDQQLRNEVLTLLSAGHETTANALAWSCYLLSQAPDVRSALDAEVDRVLHGRLPTAQDAPALPYTRMVIQEALRLYPPARVITRQAVNADTIGPYSIASGSIVLCFQWTIHRHPQFWQDPEVFRPERFASDQAHTRHPYAYFPFGGGPRKCIGYEFALLEAQLVLAMLAQRVRWTVDPDHPVVPDPLITLKPRHGMKIRLAPREL